jgi:hypothetical protein
MGYSHLEPIDPREAFTEVAQPGRESMQSAAASQAAMLLAIRAALLGQSVESPDRGAFPLPDLKSLERRRHLTVAEACAYHGVSEKELQQEPEPQLQREMAGAARALYEKPTLEVAAGLFEAAMLSPHPLVAVAGAAGARETTRLRKIIRQTLVDNAKCADPLAAQLAKAAIGHIAPMEDIAKENVIERPRLGKRRGRSHSAVVTHGTFAANNAWYQPGEKRGLKKGVGSNFR